MLLARGLCGDAVARTAADINGFRFEKVAAIGDEMMLPGAVKYGGLPALAALAAPGELSVHNNRGTGIGQWLKAAYGSCRRDRSPAHLGRPGSKPTRSPSGWCGDMPRPFTRTAERSVFPERSPPGGG